MSGMFRYFVRRLLWACVLFVAVTLVTFVIFFVIPADPARQVCGQRATAACVERARHFLGLDKPMIVQYGMFFDRLVVHQSLGRSFTNRQDVTQEVLNAAPVTGSRGSIRASG
jgi:peptide/nickel transport system permease protein